jgi:hypothetical protein
VSDITLASSQLLNLAVIDVKSDHPEPLLGEQLRERKSDVAEADNTGGESPCFDLSKEALQVRLLNCGGHRALL